MEESMGLKETCLGSLHFEWRGAGDPLLQPGRQEAGFLHHVLWPFSEQHFFYSGENRNRLVAVSRVCVDGRT